GLEGVRGPGPPGVTEPDPSTAWPRGLRLPPHRAARAEPADREPPPEGPPAGRPGRAGAAGKLGVLPRLRRTAGRATRRPVLARLDALDDRAVHALGDLVGELDAHVAKPGRLEARDVLTTRQSTCDAAAPATALCALGRGEPVLGEDVADPEPAAGPQHACHLGQDGRLVGREVDHAVRDDDVDR